MPGHRDLPDQRVAVVYLERAPGCLRGSTGAHVVLDQRNENFVPHILAITTGTSVEFLTATDVPQRFSLSKANSFDLGRYAPRSKVVRSTVRDRGVFCEIHRT